MTAKYLSRHRLDRWLAAAVVIGVFAASWYRHATVRSGTYDLAVFEQVVWKMAHGHGATSSLTAWNTFGDHLSPILLAFVPLYRIASTPLWFFAAQALALGLGVLLARPLAESVGLKDRPTLATAMVVLTAVNPALWNAAMFDFHPTTLAVPVVLLGLHAAVTHRHREMWLSFAALLLLRDDLALYGIAIAIVGWTTTDGRGRRLRAGMIAAGLGWTVLGAQIGTALGASRHFEARYGYLGTSFIDAATQPVHAAIGLLQHVFIGANFELALISVAALAFLPLGRPGWAALAAFVSLPFLAADDTFFHSYAFHYGAPVFPFLLLAAAGGAARLRATDAARLPRLMIPVGVLTLAVFGPATSGSFAAASIKEADLSKALAYVHPTDVVSASDKIGAHVADRVTVLPYPFPFLDVPVPFPLDPRVTSTAQSAKDSVDVIVVQRPATDDAKSYLAQLEKTPDIDGFERIDVGSVIVFRRS